jgi:hypothetical protein
MPEVKEKIPSWPSYLQFPVTTGVYLFLKGAILVGAWFAISKFIGKEIAAMVFLLILLIPRLPLFVINFIIHQIWELKVGSSVSWENVARIVKKDPSKWIILGNQTVRGIKSFGTYNIMGGRDDVMLYHRQTGERCAIKESQWRAAIIKAKQLHLETHLGGEVTSERIPRLIEDLKRQPDPARKLLGRVGPMAAEVAVPALIELLEYEHEPLKAKDDESFHITVPERAIVALANMGVLAKGAVPALIKVLEKAEPRTQRLVVHALGKIGPASKEAVPLIVREFEKADDLARRDIISALADIGSGAVPAVPFLIDLIERRIPWAWQAVEILKEIGAEAESAIPILEKAVHDRSRSSWERHRIKSALTEIHKAVSSIAEKSEA